MQTATLATVKDETPKGVADLVRFVAAAYEIADTDVERFELRHYAGGQDQSSHVQRWNGQPRRAPREIASEAYESAKLDARAMGGVNTYFLHWFRRGEDVPVARTSFRMAGAAIDGVAPTESATAAGMRTQEMRHHEAMAHQYMMGVGDVLDAQRSLIASQRAEIESLYADRRKLMAASEAALNERADIVLQTHQRQLETMKATGAEQRKELVTKVVVAQLAKALPVVVAKLQNVMAPELASAPAPSPGSPGDEAAAEAAGLATGETRSSGRQWTDDEIAAVVEFLTSLDAETFAAIAEVLSPTQRERLYAVAAILAKGAGT